MYAVVSSGGKQYRVEAGSTLTLERLDGEPGASLTFDRVLIIGDGDDVTVGTPAIAGASVSATVLGEALGPKLVIFKFKQKVKYRRRTGHRQHLTRVRIDEIHPTSARKAAPAAEAPAEKRTVKAKAEPRATKPGAKKAAPVSTAPTVAAAKPRAQKAALVSAAPKVAAAKPRRAAKAKAKE